eukprot:gene6934-biopygen8365
MVYSVQQLLLVTLPSVYECADHEMAAFEGNSELCGQYHSKHGIEDATRDMMHGNDQAAGNESNIAGSFVDILNPSIVQHLKDGWGVSRRVVANVVAGCPPQRSATLIALWSGQ